MAHTPAAINSSSARKIFLMAAGLLAAGMLIGRTSIAGFVRIDGVDKVAPAEMRTELNGAMARCYASGSTKIPLSSPQFARLLQLTPADLRGQTKLPLYLTLDGEQLVVHYNQPLTK